jgi:hypothetical protein
MANQPAPNFLRTYRLAPDGFAEARNKLFRQRIGLFAAILVFLVVFQYKLFGDSWQNRPLRPSLHLSS